MATTTTDSTSPTPLNQDIPPGVRDPSRRRIENPVAGEVGIVVKYSYETNGEYSEAEATCVPGGGPPVHYHRSYEERFEAISGDLTLQVADDPVRHVKPGEMVTVPIGTLHKFSAGPEGAKFKVRIMPGQPGFEKSIYILFGLSNDGLLNPKNCLPKSLLHTAVVGSLGDMYFPGAGGAVINGLTSALAAYARWSGVEDALIKKYWES